MATDEDYVGKRILVGLVEIRPDGSHGDSLQACGEIVAMSPEDGLIVDPEDWEEKMHLPYDPEALQPAKPGQYQLQDSGKIVTDPDYTATWGVQIQGDDGTD